MMEKREFSSRPHNSIKIAVGGCLEMDILGTLILDPFSICISSNLQSLDGAIWPQGWFLEQLQGGFRVPAGGLGSLQF